jgi:hypothetical protein
VKSHPFNRRLYSAYGSLDFDPNVDYYNILKVNKEASEKEIKEAFYKLAK